ncbi:ricin-type beta-trefoil lectin domain protein [Streptomyces sp. KL109B]|uniref:ricin-type beta-trefoil lectin domain protein n=2 Tax=unclassified Streptomyces TaxID=2593676 RepID=UPI00278C6319|nr:ricin-type beta-trefoil lectin domain protein [Streptomyces sp. KL109B]
MVTSASASASATATGGVHATAPDHRLVALLRADTPTAYPALGELRRRHRHALLAYALVCANDPDSGRQLAAQAFARVAREVARGAEPRGPWRHHALLHVHRAARDWAGDDRRARLAPGLLGTLGAPTAPPALLPAFHSLPPRTQTLLWHSVVDGESGAATGLAVGAPAREVGQARDAALDALRGACLTTRAARAPGTYCRAYRRLIEEATRPARPRTTADLDAHLARCPSCTAAYLELTSLRDDPRRALAEGLLPWGGTEYVTGLGETAAPPVPGPVPVVPAGAPVGRPRGHRAPRARARRRPPRGKAPRRPSMGLALASTAVGVALVPLLILTLTEGRPDLSSVGQGMAPTPTTPPPARVTVTATTTATTTTTQTATATATTTARSTETVTVPAKSSHHPPAAKPTKSPDTKPSSHPAPPFNPPGKAYAEVVNVASGLCLDISRTPMTDGDDVVAAKCDGTRSQRWRVSPARDAIQSYADPAFCLDNRGDTARTVGLWHCAAADGANAANLAFSVHADGSIRPATDEDTALTAPADGSFRVTQREFRGGSEQRWRAGHAR